MKIKQLLALALLSSFTTACQKDEAMLPDNIASISTVSAITSVDSHRRNLLIEERFEASLQDAYRKHSNTEFDFYGDFYRVFAKSSYGFTISSDRVRNGKTAARFEMRKADSNIIRAEIAGNKAETNRNRWYGFSMFLPSSEWSSDSSWDIITQFNGVPDPGEPARNPPIGLYTSNGRMKLKVIWASASISSDSNRDGEKIYDLGAVDKTNWLDSWQDMVFHINYSYKSDGILEIWKNGKKIIEHRGPNSYNDLVLPYFKVGLYKRHWPNVSRRVMYADEVRVGNEYATYNDVVPSGSQAVQTTTQTSSVILTNTGGSKYVDSISRTWSADAGFSGGVMGSKSISVSGTNDNALYLYYRYANNGAAFNYNIPVASGNYTVKLHFVEPYFKASGSRVFNVNMEGQRKLSNYDIYANTGYGKAIMKTFTGVPVTDGKLTIDFTSVKNNAIISAIEVIKQ